MAQKESREISLDKIRSVSYIILHHFKNLLVS